MKDMTPADLIEAYIKLRHKIKHLDDNHDDAMKPYKDMMLKIETQLLDHLNQNKVDSTSCPAGTAYRSTATNVSVKDWEKTLAFIRQHGRWELLEARVAKTPAVDLIEELKDEIPGVTISRTSVLRVRSGGA